MIMMSKTLLVLCLMSSLSLLSEGKASKQCQVCESVLQRFQDYVGKDVSDTQKSEKALKEFCKTLTGKDDSFCYYVGASETSATKIIGEVTKPLSYGKPVEKICKDLGKKDQQICELKYEEKIDFSSVDLWSLPVKKLKKILSGWGENCHGCVEKGDLIAKINSVRSAHVEL